MQEQRTNEQMLETLDEVIVNIERDLSDINRIVAKNSVDSNLKYNEYLKQVTAERCLEYFKHLKEYYFEENSNFKDNLPSFVEFRITRATEQIIRLDILQHTLTKLNELFFLQHILKYLLQIKKGY